MTHIKTPTKERIKSGPIQFDDDWPGVFIRGDDATFLATNLEYFLHKHEENNCHLLELLSYLKSCRKYEIKSDPDDNI